MIENQSSKIWAEYDAGLQHQKDMEFTKTWKENEDFKQGKQWPQATDRTRNLPRPVFNVIQFILNHKIAAVLNENIKMTFTPEEIPEKEGDNAKLDEAVKGAKEFTEYSDTLWEKVEQDELNEDAIDNGATNGTAIWHYFWDDDKTGGIKKIYKGDICGEVIDPANIFFGNPQNRNIQKQPYIILSTRELVSTAKELAKKNEIPVEQIDLITPDKDTTNEIYSDSAHELQGTEKVTILTKYYKKNGRVYFNKCTKGTMIQEETDLGLGSKRGFKLYPIEVMAWGKRKKSIFGTSEVEGLIPNQKAINFNIAMMLLSIQETAWPKIITKLGALTQQITNSPGEILTDNLQNGMDNIKYMQTPNFPAMAVGITDKVMELTRLLTGVGEVAAGEGYGANMSAAAIIALQNQNKIPTQSIQKRYYRSMKAIGRIWEEFLKIKYNIDRSVTVKDINGKESSKTFNGSKYEDTSFTLKVNVGPSSSYSEGLTMTSLDKLYDRKAVTDDEYIELAPDNVIPFKDRLKKMREDRKQSEFDAMEKFFKTLPLDIQQMLQKMPPEQMEMKVREMMLQQGNSNTLPQ